MEMEIWAWTGGLRPDGNEGAAVEDGERVNGDGNGVAGLPPVGDGSPLLLEPLSPLFLPSFLL